MTLKLLESVVLTHDVPESGLRRGDVGTVVHVYESDGIEVEFVGPSGHTVGVVTLRQSDVRAAQAGDVLSVRSSA